MLNLWESFKLISCLHFNNLIYLLTYFVSWGIGYLRSKAMAVPNFVLFDIARSVNFNLKYLSSKNMYILFKYVEM